MDSVIDKFNKTFQSENFNFNDVLKYKATLVQEKEVLEQSLKDDGEVSSKVVNVGRSVKESQRSFKELLNQVDDLDLEVEKHQAKVQRVLSLTKDHIHKIALLEKKYAYLSALSHIQDISNVIEAGLNDRGGLAVTNYLKLCALSHSLQSSSCTNLLRYLKDTINYWHSFLKERFGEEYEEILKSLKWPYLGTNVPPVPSQELLSRFASLTETLIHIQLPGTCTEPDKTFSVLSLPIIFLIRPLKKRFLFHFSGSRQTNRPDKPEWYFTQILTWVKNNQEFVEKNLHPVFVKMQQNVNARVEFISGLVEVVIEKLHKDLIQLQYDDFLFSHTIDEALGFTRELREGYGYPETQISVLSVLTQAQFFVKWIHLEKKYSLEKLDSIMRSESAFQRLLPVNDEEYTTECVEKFLTMLTSLTDRYCHLPQPGHRLQFLQLQMDLLDDFRVRLLQLLRAPGEEAPSSVLILNSVNCLIHVIEEWSVTPHFLQLQFYRNQMQNEGGSDDQEEGVFDDVIALFTSMQEDLLTSLVDNLVCEVKAKSYPYLRDCWHVMKDANEELTPSGVNMLCALTTGLNTLHDTLTPRLRLDALNRVTSAVDEFLFEELVMMVHFSPLGAESLAFDVRRCLYSLFGQYLPKPQAHLPLLSDACALLTLSQGTALLLRSSLTDLKGEEDSHNNVLADVGVSMLNPRRTLQVLTRRVDMVD